MILSLGQIKLLLLLRKSWPTLGEPAGKDRNDTVIVPVLDADGTAWMYLGIERDGYICHK